MRTPIGMVAPPIMVLCACTGRASSLQTSTAASDASRTTYKDSNAWCVTPTSSHRELPSAAVAAVERIPPSRWAKLPHGAEWTFTLSDTVLARGRTAQLCAVFRNRTSDSTSVAVEVPPDDVEVVVKDARGASAFRADSGAVSDLMLWTYRLAPHGVLLFPQHLPPATPPVASAWLSLPSGRYAVYASLQMDPDSLVLAKGPPPIYIEIR
jgi:hypothetical protein